MASGSVPKLQNADVAEFFLRLADLLEIEGANPYRVMAYRNAARTLENLSENIRELLDKKTDLTAYRGIGEDLAGKIAEIVETGRLSLLDETEKRTPSVLRELLRLPGMGPKKVQALYKNLGVKSLEELRAVVEDGRILALRGFGEKTAARLLEELRKKQIQKKSRMNPAEAEASVHRLMEYLSKAPGIKKTAAAGSFRRRKDTVGDLDFLATAKNPREAIAYFTEFPEVSKILARGPTKSTVLLNSGLQVDLRLVPDASYGAALIYFTGSKAHNIALRSMAIKKGRKINEYGLFKGSKVLKSKTEKEIYRSLGLRYIEPELRENRGEIEAALEDRLPELLRREDLRGDLHVHTAATDGMNSLEEMAEAARRLGYSYIAVTDHTKSLSVSKGLDEERLLRQIDEIDRLNQRFRDFTILKSAEVDILEDGSLDLTEDVLARLDLRVCAVHSHFHLSREQQTERILRAMESPYFNILAHPTGRLLGRREPYALDMEKVLLQAKKRGRILEINGQPERMDLPDFLCKAAKDLGVKMAVSTDAHGVSQLEFIRFGVAQARRGWLEKNDVVNSLSLSRLLKLFQNDAARVTLAAGIIPFRREHGRRLYLLLRSYAYWDFPKGELNPEEEPWAGARRELQEETGIARAEPYGFDFFETDVYGKNKKARYYPAEVSGSEVRLSREHHEFRWLPYRRARALLTPRVREALDWAENVLAGKSSREAA